MHIGINDIKPIKNELVDVRKSNIHGNGVFAKKLINKGTKIAYYTGIEMSYKEFNKKYGKDFKNVYKRMPWLPLIVSKESKNIINFINDGTYLQSNPKINCILKKRWLISIIDINKDDEILIKYFKNYWKQ